MVTFATAIEATRFRAFWHRISRLLNSVVPMHIRDMLTGYARVLTDDQDLRQQHGLLTEAGCRRILEDKGWGASRDRSEMAQLLDQIRAGDVVVLSRALWPRAGRLKRVQRHCAAQTAEISVGRSEQSGDRSSPRGGNYMITEVVETEQPPRADFDGELAGTTFDQLIDAVSDLLPVNRVQYPDLPEQLSGAAMQFCLRHSALHFSKTAGRLAAFVEDADHGSFQEIEKLEGIVAASLINSFKLADEIGLSGSRLVESIRLRFSQHVQEV